MFSKLAALSLFSLAFAAPVPGPTKYIVVLKPGSQTESLVSNLDGVTISHNYAIGDFKGFAADLTADHVASLKADPRVCIVQTCVHGI
jgi:hypothetical protein